MKKKTMIGFLSFLLGVTVSGQQTTSQIEPPRTADREFKYEIKDPAYPAGQGPVVLVDEAHFNFHTSVGTYFPFSRLLKQDGFVIRRGQKKSAGNCCPPAQSM